MKYFVYTYNYLTLFKAVSYARSEWGVENTYIVYTAFVNDPPKGFLESNLNKLIIKEKRKPGKLPVFDYVRSLYEEKRLVNAVIDYISKEQPDTSDKMRLVVFRDNHIRESMLIDKIKKRYDNAEIILIEEGLALYATSFKVKHNTQYHIKSIIHAILGVPDFTLKGLPHGSNPKIDQIYCRHPEALEERYKDSNKIVSKEIDLYNEDHCKYFINDILGLNIEKTNYKYVFLSQPLFPHVDERLNEKYRAFITTLFNITANYGALLIKPHPKDKWDYSQHVSSRIGLSDTRTSNCPFECLMGYYGNPQTITLFSSAGCNIETGKPNIFLYDMFPEIVRSDIFDEEFIKNNNIVRCSTLEEFEKTLIRKDIGG